MVQEVPMTYQIMCEGVTAADDAIAGRAAKVLMQKYPVQSPHMWMVNVRDNCIWLKSSMTGKACMIRHLSKINDSSFEKEIERAAGELLERAHLSRVNMEMDYAKRLDGGEAIKWRPAVLSISER
jgi:hypothetical protein